MGTRLKGKLIQSLSVLQPEEWERFFLFLKSPYFNNGKDADALRALFQFCEKHRTDFEQEAFEKENAYAFVFPAQKEVKGKLEKLMTKLLGLLNEFIWIEKSKTEKNKSKLLVEFYRERNLANLAESELKKWKKGTEASPLLDGDFFWDKYLLNKEEALFEVSFKRSKNASALINSLSAFDAYYILEKLEQACWLYSQKLHQHIGVDNSVDWIGNFISILEESHYVEIPSVRLYLSALQILMHKDESADVYFSVLEKELKNAKDILPEKKLQFLNTILRIYAVGRYNNGAQDFLQPVFRLYKNHLEKGWLYFNGKLYPEILLNIVNLGLRAGEDEWVLQTLKKYRKKIWDQSGSEEVYHFNLTQYYFHKKDFEKAEKLLSDNYQNFYYKVAARRLEIKLLYEQKSILLLPKIEAFKMFIFRLSKNQLPEKLKQLNNNFIDLVRQLIHPKTLGNSSRIEKIKEKIVGKEKVAERDWLLEKIEELN